jgi:exosortase
VALFGLVLLLCGWQVMKIAWFPIAFLVAALPWPQLVYSWVAMPLQELAAGAATFTLRATGVDAFRSGTKIHMMGQGGAMRTLNVAEACAGLKSLMTFIAVAAAVAFLSFRPLWQKVLITLSAIPIAIFCNMARVTGQGMLDYYVSQKWSQSFAHQFAGMVMMIPAFFLILLVAWVVDNIFIEEVDKRELANAKGAKGADAGLVIEVPRGGAIKRPANTGAAAAAKPGPAATKPIAAPAAKASPAAPAGAGDSNELAAATQRLMAGGSIRSRRPASGGAAGTTDGQKQEGR